MSLTKLGSGALGGSLSQSEKTITRRTFLNRTTSATVTAAILGGSNIAMATPKTALSRGRILGANDRISLGHVGVGQRGRGLEFILSNLKDSKNVEIVGVCDLWKVNLERATTSVRGTYGHAPL